MFYFFSWPIKISLVVGNVVLFLLLICLSFLLFYSCIICFSMPGSSLLPHYAVCFLTLFLDGGCEHWTPFHPFPHLCSLLTIPYLSFRFPIFFFSPPFILPSTLLFFPLQSLSNLHSEQMNCMPRNWSTKPSVKNWITLSMTWLQCKFPFLCFLHLCSYPLCSLNKTHIPPSHLHFFLFCLLLAYFYSHLLLTSV